MWRLCLLLVAVLGWATFAGCQCQAQPEPLTPDQERELKQRMQQVQEEESSQLAPEGPGGGTGNR